MVWDTADRITFSRYSTNRLVYSVVAVAVVFAFASSLTWMVARLAGALAGRVSSARQLIIIDTDPGVDDVVAILTTLGDPSVKVLGITCVRGNTDVPNVAINALKALLVARNSEVPVYTGTNYGLISSPPIDSWFGSDGLGDLPFSDTPSVTGAQEEPAASFLARTVKQYPGEITIFALGPLTNIALALHLNPQFLQQARRVVILGGSIRGQGNAAPGVEFNFFMDPDAATLVLDRALSSAAPVTIMPMETVVENDLNKEWRWNVLAKINNSVVTFLNQIETKVLEMHPSQLYHPFDTYAAAVTLCPDFVTFSQELYGFVENGGRKTNGALVIDYMNLTGNVANVEVVTEVNTTALRKKMFDNLSSYS